MSGIVPIVDIGGWEAAGPAGRQQIAERVDQACRQVGFLQVSGHGIGPDVVAAALAASDQFFALPVAEKLRSRPDRAEINRGYAPLGSEALAYSLGRPRPPDLFEAFNIADDSMPPGTPASMATLFAPNIWPLEPPDFQPAIWDYFCHAVALSRTLLDIFAIALDLEDGWFRTRTDHATLTMRTIRYDRHPDSPAGLPSQEQLGMSEHTDYGIVTVLYADAIAGLQIVDQDGTWHDVVPEPGNLLVNLGDLLAQWTNDRWKSTIHRVVPPPPGTVRRSMAMFNDGNYDTVVEALPTCTSGDEPPRYPATTAGEHLMAKLLGPRQLVRATATDTTAGRLPAG